MIVPPEPRKTRGVPPRLALTLATAAALVLAIGVASVRMNPSRWHRLVVVLPEAPGLIEDGPVTYLGVNAGRVERIDLSTGRVVATLAISRPDVVLRAGDVVRLRAAGLFGEQFVDIMPGPRSGRVLADGDTIVVSHAQMDASPRPASIDSALRSLLGRRDSTPAARPGSTATVPAR